MVLAGAPAIGYGIGAVTWILLRLLDQAVDQRALAVGEPSQLVALRLGYRFMRLAVLVVAVVLADKWVAKHDALTVALVILVGITIQLAWSIVHHVGPLARAHPTGKVSESATTIRPAGASSMTVGSSTSTEVEAVRVQDFRERLGEVVDELLLAVARGIDLGDRAQLGV